MLDGIKSHCLSVWPASLALMGGINNPGVSVWPASLALVDGINDPGGDGVDVLIKTNNVIP